MRYFRRHWNESRGDEYDHWGACTYLFEVDEDLYACREIEIYEHGAVLRYDRRHFHDQYGGLADQRFARTAEEFESEWTEFELQESKFEQVWASQKAVNRVEPPRQLPLPIE
jgi:hypothetical protein